MSKKQTGFTILAKIEIYFRAKLGYFLGSKANNAQDDPQFFPQVIKRHNGREINYRNWRETIQRRFERACANHDPVALHHKKNYGGNLPIWVFVDFFDFADLSQMFALMVKEDQHQIADSLGLSRAYKEFNSGNGKRRKQLQDTSLISWLECLTVARNICAHHARLWDTTHIRPMNIKDGRTKGYFSDISTKSNSITGVYGVLTIALLLLAEIEECENWVRRLRDLIETSFTPNSNISEKDMGFPHRNIWCNILPWNIIDSENSPA